MVETPVLAAQSRTTHGSHYADKLRQQATVPAVLYGELQIDGAIHVRELHLPEGVTALDDPDAVVIHVKQPLAEAEAAPAAPAAETAEPEVIGRKAGEEEEVAE